MKRTLSIIISLLLLSSAIFGCTQTSPHSNDKLSVVCTIFPQYDWARRIIGGNKNSIDLTLMSEGGIDMHSFQPSVEDIIKLSACDLFIYVGGESDEWVDEALRQAENPDMLVINLLDVLGDAAKTEDVIEGMEGDDEEHNEAAYDEHVWLSLKNAEMFAAAITDAFSSLDTENAGEYRANLAEYTNELRELDAKYQQVIGAAPVKTLLFGDRFPFRYLVDDYGLSYYAAFPGCSAETEASFDTIIFLAGKVNELNLHSVIVTESSDKSIAETIINNTAAKDQKIYVLNSFQAVNLTDIENGATYLSIMDENLNVLTEMLK